MEGADYAFISLLISIYQSFSLILEVFILKHTEVFVPASERSYKIGVVGNNWLVGWLVGKAVFSEASLRIFLIFCMKLGDYKDRKVTEPDF